MLLANYASDSDSDNEDSSKAGPSTIPQKNLPPPRPAVIQSNASVKKRKGPVKITLELPKSKNTAGDDEDVDASVSDEDKDLSSKKPKFNIKGKGSSALLGMLPPPKRKLPTSTTRSSSLAVNKSMATPRPKVSSDTPDMGGLSASDIAAAATSSLGDGEDANEDGGMMLPPSLRGKAKPKAEPAVDLFGLSSVLTPIPSSSKTPIPPTISSAPAAPDFIPPIPSPEDPYPGYYQTPSGEWKAYDPKYYASFFAPETKLQGEEHDDGRVGRHWEEFDTKGADLLDVDVSSSLKAARAEEERKNLIKKPKMPGDEYEYQAIGQTKGLAAQRHQLTSLLHNAYSSREELEERIAQNKKNMRLAGQKYGF